MLKLYNTLKAWGTPEFESVLKRELAQCADQLPLQKALAAGNYIVDEPPTAVIESTYETEKQVHVRAGIFFKSVIGGCSCDGDPTPVSENDEYCEMQFDIDKSTAATAVTILE